MFSVLLKFNKRQLKETIVLLYAKNYLFSSQTSYNYKKIH